MGGNTSCSDCGANEYERLLNGNTEGVSYITTSEKFGWFKAHVYDELDLEGDIYSINLSSPAFHKNNKLNIFHVLLSLTKQIFIPVTDEIIEHIKEEYPGSLTLEHPVKPQHHVKPCYGDNGYKTGDETEYDFTERCCSKSYQNMRDNLKQEATGQSAEGIEKADNNRLYKRMSKLYHSDKGEYDDAIQRNLNEVNDRLSTCRSRQF
jgi:hypothetical protein